MNEHTPFIPQNMYSITLNIPSGQTFLPQLLPFLETFPFSFPPCPLEWKKLGSDNPHVRRHKRECINRNRNRATVVPRAKDAPGI